MREEISYLSEF